MHAEALANPQPTHSSAESLMGLARWMADFLDRHASDSRYYVIKSRVHRSQITAGGPALRLMQSVWNYNTLTYHPTDKNLKVSEENSFAHLWHNHRDAAKKHYHVWYAIENFGQRRIKNLGMPLLATVHQPPVDEPNPLRDALRMLDTSLFSRPLEVQKHHAIRLAMDALASANPTDETIIRAVIEATAAFAAWRANTTSIDAYDTYRKAANAALHLQYSNRAYLRNKAFRLDIAITSLCHEYPPPA